MKTKAETTFFIQLEEFFVGSDTKSSHYLLAELRRSSMKLLNLKGRRELFF